MYLSSRLALISIALAAAALIAQAPPGTLDSHPTRKPPAVSYLFPEQVTIAAGKPSPVDLHFKVAEGLHVNSHTPASEELIPTTFTLPEASGVHLARAEFPAGADFELASSPDLPKEKLSVYTGDFIIHTQLVATKGEHLVEATLRYQACSNNTCMPPKSIPVTIDVIAK